MRDPATTAVHGPADVCQPAGALRPPLHDTAAFEFADAETMADAFAGRKALFTYSRMANPTVAEFERRMAGLLAAPFVVSTGSGMAAISAVVLCLGRSGGTLLIADHLFANTCSLLDRTLAPWGLQFRTVNILDLAAVAAAIDDTCFGLLFETLSNPQLNVADIAGLSAICRKKNIPLIGDTTLTPPGMLDVHNSGIDVEVISTSKYFSGGGTCIGGMVADHGSFDWAKNPNLATDATTLGPAAFMAVLRRHVHRNVGASFSAHNAWLMTLGMETLFIRLKALSANAQHIAEGLAGNPEISRIRYPGLPGDPAHDSAVRQFAPGIFGPILTIDLGTKAAAFRFLNNLKLVYRATNVCDNKSLAIHCASTIFCDYSEAQRSSMDVTEGQVRLSIGLEKPEEILADILQALTA